MVRPRVLTLSLSHGLKLVALLVALALGGCATPTTIPGHQDPEIWRPQNVEYPLP